MFLPVSITIIITKIYLKIFKIWKFEIYKKNKNIKIMKICIKFKPFLLKEGRERIIILTFMS